jgi:hypothetical protein
MTAGRNNDFQWLPKNVMAVTDVPCRLPIIKPTLTRRRIEMMNFGYHKDDVMDGANFFEVDPEEYDLLSVESFSDSFEVIESDEEVTDFDDKSEFLMEDIMKGYEIYNLS